MLNYFGLKKIVDHAEFANALHGLIPLAELRANGVKAKDLLELQLPPGALYNLGEYKDQELIEAGISKDTIKTIQRNTLFRNGPKRKK